MSALGHSRPSHFVPVLNNVRYASDSDHSRYESELTLWAITGLMHRSKQRPLFDHLVGGREQRRRDSEVQRFGGLSIDDKIKFSRLDDRQISRGRSL
jgi:hypothetical protein